MTEAELLSQIKPGMAISILGEPGSGKTGLALRVAELLKKNYGLGIWVYGIPRENRKYYPPSVHFLDSIDDLSQAPNDAVLVYEELSLTAHSRRAMAEGNILLTQLQNVRRHHNLTLICVCQRGSEMDKNLAASTQLLLIKRPEPFQHLRGSDRPQFEYHLKKAAELYKDPKIKKPECWVYVSTLEKLVRNDLPSFWNNQISLSLGSPGPVGMKSKAGFREPKPAHQMSRDEKIVEALILRMEGKSYREIGRDHLSVHHSTVMSYCSNYKNHPLSRLPDEEYEALEREAKMEFARRNETPEMLPEEDWEEEPEPEVTPEPVSLRASVTGRCQTGHVFHEEDGKRSPFCIECGTRVVWGHTRGHPSLVEDGQGQRDRTAKVKEDYQSQKALLVENFERAGLDAKDGKLKEVALVGTGMGVGAIPLFAIDAIDSAIDDTHWTAKGKRRAKWIQRIADLVLGVAGTATNLPPILKGEPEWYNWLLSGASIEQIPISLYKMLELFRGSASPMPMEEPVQDWRENPMVKNLLSRQEEETEEVPPPTEEPTPVTATQKEEGQRDLSLSEEEAHPETSHHMSNVDMTELLADIRECTSKVMDDPQLLSIWNDVLDIVVSDGFSDDEKTATVARVKACAVANTEYPC